jgi:NAD(P)-dependent dehydrogenase (short-subunit alcohol dehydrogenase family)
VRGAAWSSPAAPRGWVARPPSFSPATGAGRRVRTRSRAPRRGGGGAPLLGGPDPIGLSVDVGDTGSVTAAFEQIAARWGVLNVLVNTVGQAHRDDRQFTDMMGATRNNR